MHLDKIVNKGLFCLFIFTILFNKSVIGQSDFSFSLGGGVMYYNGDLSDSKILPPSEILKPYYSLDISMLVIDRLDLSLRYLHGQVEGDDALVQRVAQHARLPGGAADQR